MYMHANVYTYVRINVHAIYYVCYQEKIEVTNEKKKKIEIEVKNDKGT